MWKLHEARDSMVNPGYLKNKANAWSSDHKWDMIEKDKFVIMKNIATNKALTIEENEIDVTEDTLNEDNIRQMWIKGMDKNPTSKEDYFTLSNSTSEKFLTATPNGLIISFGEKLDIIIASFIC